MQAGRWGPACGCRMVAASRGRRSVAAESAEAVDLAKLSDGDLRQKVEIGSDAQGSLLLAIQEMQARIRTLVAQVAAAAQSVVGASGSMRDDEVIKAADEAGLAMVFTGHRHFRH